MGEENNVNTANSYSVESNWYADFGATDHVTGDLEKLAVREPYNGSDQIYTASGSSMHIEHIGKSVIPTPYRDLDLHRILHVTRASKNLVSIHRITSDNIVFFELHSKFFLIKDHELRKIILHGRSRGGIYPLPCSSTTHTKQVHSVSKVPQSRWHAHLGHPSSSIVKVVLSKNSLPYSIDSSQNFVCDACQQAKCHQLPYPTSSSVSTTPLDELIFSDVWGLTCESIGRNKYYVSFIDDYSKFTWAYLLKHKSNVLQKFRKFQSLVERLFDKKILVMQTGGQYQRLNSYFRDIGIVHQVSCPHNHQ
jgi:hypothetical protein